MINSASVFNQFGFLSTDEELGRMRRRVAARLRNRAVFDANDYLTLNPDLKNDDPYWHYAEWGVWEKRPARRPVSVARALGHVTMEQGGAIADYCARFEGANDLSPAAQRFRDRELIGVLYHSNGNHYMEPIAAAIAYALQRAGARCMLLTERHAAASLVTCPIVVAPHEFFKLRLPYELNSASFRLRAVMYNTEQLPSQWFGECVPLLLASKGVIDINFQSAHALAATMPATYLLPPFNSELRDRRRYDAEPSNKLFASLPSGTFDFIDGGPIDARPIDIFFAGYKTPGRERFFSRTARFLAERECFLAYSPQPDKAVPLDADTRSLFPTYLRLAAATKIILNIHRFAVGFFEWERMVAQGFSSGACVAATPCMRAPFFVPGVHYFEAISRNLDKLLAWLLDAPDGRRAAQAAADASRAMMESTVTPQRSGRFLLEFLAGLEAAA